MVAVTAFAFIIPAIIEHLLCAGLVWGWVSTFEEHSLKRREENRSGGEGPHGGCGAHTLQPRPRGGGEELGPEVYFPGPGAALYSQSSLTGGRGGLRSSGGGNTGRGDLGSPPELLCAGWWKRRRLEPARE